MHYDDDVLLRTGYHLVNQYGRIKGNKTMDTITDKRVTLLLEW